MSLEVFHLLDNEPLDNSIIKRVFTEIYHRQGDKLNQSDQNFEFIIGENNNYHQIGNAYLEFNITVRKNDLTIFHKDDSIRLVNNAFAFCFKEARLITSIGGDIEINKNCGPISTIMRVISNKDGNLLSQFDNINENDIPILNRLTDLPVQIRDKLHHKMLINNHTDANKGKIKRYLHLEDIFGFCKIFKKVTKSLGFHLTFKTNDLQNIIYSFMADDINVTFNKLYLFIFGENNNYHQIGNGYLEINITVRKDDTTIFHREDPFRLVNNGYAFCFKEARLSSTIGSDIEHNRFCGQISTIMKVVSNKDDDFLSQFGNINENDIPLFERLADLPPQIRPTPHQKMLIGNHIDSHEGKIKG